MRDDQQLTDEEVVLDEQALLVSVTDLDGVITRVNRDFVEISGFAEGELIGQPHNIVRHPDMPAAVFADLWRDLKAGRPWSGIIKSRCRHGAHYWSRVNVAPVREDGKITGYMAVRRKATPRQVEIAAQAYARLGTASADGLEISHGVVGRAGVGARLRRALAGMPASRKIVLGVLSVLLVGIGLAALLLNHYVAEELDARGRAALQREVELVAALAQHDFDAMRREAELAGRAFVQVLPEDLVLEDGAAGPLLRSVKGEIVDGEFAPIDRFAARTGSAVTVLARYGKGFVSVATSRKMPDGSRAVGESLSRNHPAYADLMAGKPFAVRDASAGARYTSYQPLVDAAGQVIGACVVSLDVSAEMEALKQGIRQRKVGRSGYYFVLDAAPGSDYGRLAVHPAKEGSNPIDARDGAGRTFIREMLERQSGEIVYPWMNAELGDDGSRDKIVAFVTLPGERWLLAGGTYLEEFHDQAQRVSRYVALGGLALSLLLAFLIASMIRRLIVRPLQERVIPVFGRLAEGDYDNPIDISGNDEVGQVLQGLHAMQILQGFKVAEDRRLANENLRIRSALDCVATNLRIADYDGTVLYANKGMLATLAQLEPRLREQQPGFSAAGFVGSNIGAFYPDPRAAIRALQTLAGARQGELEIGGRIFNVITNPIVNARGQRLGSVGEWVDRTAEITAQRSVAALVARAAAGDLDARLDVSLLEGFYRELGEGINALLASSSGALGELAGLLERLALGDLTRQVEGDFHGAFAKLRDDANTTVGRLRELVGNIKNTADSINTAAQEIAGGNQDLSSRTEEQASSLEETASSMEELTGTVRQNAENARQASELANGARRVAEQGGVVVGEAVKTMGAIHLASNRIADIIGVIDGIAFQTNILALNAAVEAARAGEQGRGFAVVATEVRSLAQRCAASAKEIKALISDSVERVDAGHRQVDHAGRTMAEIVASITRVANIVADITAASREQSRGIEQVSRAVTQMDEVTQQNAALVEQAAAAAESLEGQARQLKRRVAVFRFEDGSLPTASPSAPPANKKAAGAERLAARRPAILPATLDDEWEEF